MIWFSLCPIRLPLQPEPPQPDDPPSSMPKHIELFEKVIISRNSNLFDPVWESLLEISPLKEKSKDQQKEIVKMLVFALKQELLKPAEEQNKDLINKVSDKLEPIIWDSTVASDIVGDVAKASIEDIINKAKDDKNPNNQKIYLDCIKALCERFKGIPDNPQLETFCNNYKEWLKNPIEFKLVSIKAKCTYKHGGFIESVKCNNTSINCSKDRISNDTFINNNINGPFYSRPDEGIKLDITGNINDGAWDSRNTSSQMSVVRFPFITSNFKYFSSTSILRFKGITDNIRLVFVFKIKGKFVEDLYNEAFKTGEEAPAEDTESPEQPENESEDVSQ